MGESCQEGRQPLALRLDGCRSRGPGAVARTTFCQRPLAAARPIDPQVASMRPVRSLTVLAWWNVGLHLLGLVLAALAMAPGTPLVPLDERLAYLAAAPPGW